MFSRHYGIKNQILDKIYTVTKCYIQHKCYAVISNLINNWQPAKKAKSKNKDECTTQKKEESQKATDKHYCYAFAHCYGVKTLGKTQ